MSPIPPPFRADHVGSLLRPPKLIEARRKRAAGEIDAEELRGIEDEAIAEAIRMQEDIGLKAVTDGEYRRAFWHFDFMEGVGGVTMVRRDDSVMFHGEEGDHPLPPIYATFTGKVDWVRPHMVDHFAFVKEHTKVTPKISIPSPSALHFRYGRKDISEDIYPDLEEFHADIGTAYNKAMKDFAAAGCTYFQLDEVFFTYLCDPRLVAEAKEIGHDADALPSLYARMVNRALEGKPDNMTAAMHLCRGNFRSSWVAEGGYDSIADTLFNEMNIDGYFMEYDSARSGGFEPLRFLPKGKRVVLGLITSKTGELENPDDVKRRIDEAATFAPIEQLALSPQCGFASTEEGNLLSYDEQRAKLELIVKIAQDVWGEV